MLLRARLLGGIRSKAARGELRRSLPVGLLGRRGWRGALPCGMKISASRSAPCLHACRARPPVSARQAASRSGIGARGCKTPGLPTARILIPPFLDACHMARFWLARDERWISETVKRAAGLGEAGAEIAQGRMRQLDQRTFSRNGLRPQRGVRVFDPKARCRPAGVRRMDVQVGCCGSSPGLAQVAGDKSSLASRRR